MAGKVHNFCFFLPQPEFVKALSDILYHGGNSPVARMAAGLQLKNTLTSKDQTVKTQYQQRWLAFPEDTRAYVKKNVSKWLFYTFWYKEIALLIFTL